jgi:xanthine dehydrogenase accessory factor
LKKQIHNSEAGEEHSGMICSGEQTVILYELNKSHELVVSQIIDSLNNDVKGVLTLSPEGLFFSVDEKLNKAVRTSIIDETDWEYKQLIGYKNRICIIGAGHVGLALSKLMKDLDFIVEVFDDRKDLNTFNDNIYADKKHLVDYKNIDEVVPQGESVYVVIMTFAHKSDEDVLQKLIGKNYKYLGLMGSKAKVAKLYENIGYNPSEDGAPKVYSPVGIPIKSKTPMEIAVSIAAEIISIKNA